MANEPETFSSHRNSESAVTHASPKDVTSQEEPRAASLGVQSFNGYRDLLEELANTRMPFGKYSGRLLTDLPPSYLCWFARKGFPPGKLGMLLESALEIKTNGLTQLLKPLVKKTDQGPHR